MARSCKFCEHPDRKSMETEVLRRGKTQKEIAKILGVTSQAVSIHIRKHIPEAVRLAISQGKATAAGLNVTEQLIEINRSVLKIADSALEDGHAGVALQAFQEVRKQLEYQSKLLGDISEGLTVNIINSPQYIEFKTLVLKTLEKHPKARKNLVESLKNANLN